MIRPRAKRNLNGIAVRAANSVCTLPLRVCGERVARREAASRVRGKLNKENLSQGNAALQPALAALGPPSPRFAGQGRERDRGPFMAPLEQVQCRPAQNTRAGFPALAQLSCSAAARGYVMHRHRREVLRLAASAAALAALPRTARAENYPARPVRLIVGYPAGGSTDLVARIIGPWLSDRLGQSFVVENRPGAGTNIAVQAAVASPADGYTLLFPTTTHPLNASFHTALPFYFLRHLAPVAALADTPLLTAAARAQPGKTISALTQH